MARARRTPHASSIRIFRTESGSKIAELKDVGFGDEDHLHKLIEKNIGTLFQNLTFLRREFRELDAGLHRLDTVAFDRRQNTFVAIEYKNKLDRGVIDQAKAYLTHMKKNRHALMVEYVNNVGGGALDLKSYNWEGVYAIIMAPEFHQNQIDSAEDDGDLELHEVRRYDDGTMTVRRVGGAHERAQAAARRSDPTPDASKQAAAPSLNDAGGDVVLPDVKHARGMKCPAVLALPDGSRVALKSWAGILAGVADWLVGKGYLNESHCPVPIGKNNAILNTKPFHQNGSKFRRHKKSGSLHVFLGVDPANALRHSVKLIGVAGLDPSDFMVSFGGSARPTRPKTPPPLTARVTITKGSSVPGCEKASRCYVPHAAIIGVGGRVVWTNDDVTAHTVTNGAPERGWPDGSFDSGLFRPGAEFSHVFDEAGKYPYFDLAHPWMRGVVVVKE